MGSNRDVRHEQSVIRQMITRPLAKSFLDDVSILSPPAFSIFQVPPFERTA